MALIHLWRALIFSMMTLVASGPSLAGEPTEKIKATTDKIIAIVSDTTLKGPGKADERKRLIRQAVDERFDWEEMSRRSLARHWARRTAEEKKEFIDLFGKLLERTYLDKVEGYSGERVLYDGENVDPDDSTYVSVKVRFLTKKAIEIPVAYRLLKKNNDWRVYDISIEGVSLVNNYRRQFKGMPYGKLIKRLRTKIAENK
ncbi:MAG: ABC transporter substrate-binding protein [Deltaproteobacteria bacterium]|nr:ABC transporter substrate-binding protein [Deltaproteobacteria bacterium]